MKRVILAAIIAMGCSAATDAQILRTTVAQGEIEGWRAMGLRSTRTSHTPKPQRAT